MLAITTLSIVASAALKKAQAMPTHHNEECTSFNIPVPITSHQHLYDVVHVDSSIDAMHSSQDFDTWSSPSFVERIIDNITITRTYDIYAKLCIPHNGAKRNLLQIATHGGGFDSRYWDAQVEPEKYSYVKAALDRGYSILTYDRISTGRSSKPDAYTDVQIPAEVEVLRGISEMVRNGKIMKHAAGYRNSHSNVSFDKIIHVGHSIGSVTTYGLTVLYPELSDAAVLTGFIVNKEIYEKRQTSDALEYAPENDPVLFADSSSGYTVQGTPSSLQAGFFSSRPNSTSGIGGFDPKMLAYAFSIRQPTSVVEHGTAEVLYAASPIAPEYAGPVQFLVGEFDFVVCAGDCKAMYNATMVNEMYPKAKDVDIKLQPGAGHGLPFHHSAQMGFKTSFEWLNRNGL